VNLVMNL